LAAIVLVIDVLADSSSWPYFSACAATFRMVWSTWLAVRVN
jgi:hypothetical protein